MFECQVTMHNYTYYKIPVYYTTLVDLSSVKQSFGGNSYIVNFVNNKVLMIEAGSIM